MLPTVRTCAVGAAVVGMLALHGTGFAAASAPHLTFPCSAIPPPAGRSVVTCHLAGQGFARHEALTVTYRVEIQWMQGPRKQNQRRVTTYRRPTSTDGRGAFRRPAFWFAVPTGVDVQVWKIWVQVQVVGVHGERATTGIGGIAD